MPASKRKNNDSAAAAKKKKLQRYFEGDAVLCCMDMGVWWPGFVTSKTTEKHVLVGFWNEDTIVHRTLAKVQPYDETSSLISNSISKLKRKKEILHLEKYMQDLQFAKIHPLVTDKEPAASCTVTETEKSAAKCTMTEIEKSAASCTVAETEKPFASCTVNETEKPSTSCTVTETEESTASCTVTETEEPAASCTVTETEKPSTSCTVTKTEKNSASCTVTETEESAAICTVTETEEPAASCTVTETEEPAASCTVTETEKPAASCTVTETEEPAASCTVTETEEPAASCTVTETEEPAASCSVTETEEPAASCTVTETEKPSASCTVTETEEPASSCTLTETEKPAASCTVTETEEPAVSCSVTGSEEPAASCTVTECQTKVTFGNDIPFYTDSEEDGILDDSFKDPDYELSSDEEEMDVVSGSDMSEVYEIDFPNLTTIKKSSDSLLSKSTLPVEKECGQTRNQNIATLNCDEEMNMYHYDSEDDSMSDSDIKLPKLARSTKKSLDSHVLKSTLPDENDSVQPAKRNLSSNVCTYDINYPDIFTKTFQKDANMKSKHGRLYDIRYACCFCCKLMTNIQTHLEHKHRKEKDVKDIMDLRRKIDDADSIEKSRLQKKLHSMQAMLRNRGNHEHNQKVLASKGGEILLSRRKSSSQFDLREYGPCPDCFDWIILDNITIHKQPCPKKGEQMGKGSSILQSSIIKGKIIPSGSVKLRKEVFPSMIRDEATDIAQGDQLIIALGDTWLMKNIGNVLRRKNFTSFRMRLAARLLIMMQNESCCKGTMCDFLKPANFDLFVKCALAACKEDEHANLKNPSTAIKLGYDLTRLASSKLGYTIKEMDDNAKQEATDFLKLLQMEWSVKVTKQARVTLEERHFNKTVELPDPQDIVCLASYLTKALTNLNLGDVSANLFREVIVLTQSRLMLYNRRRPGELESLRVESYKARRGVSETDLSLRQNLTKLEETLLKSHDLVEIRGKTGRGVPLLIPNETRRMLQFLSKDEYRDLAGIKSTNGYVFANTGDTVVRAGESIEEVRSRPEVKLKYPSRIYANNLRKQTATIAQVLSLDDSELKWLCNHLGHTMKVHENYYRQTSGMIERIDIAKLMLIQESNSVAQFAGRKLSEIQFDEIDIADKFEQNKENHPRTESQPEENDMNENIIEDDGIDYGMCLRKKPAKVKREKWTNSEEEEIRKYFQDYFHGDIQKKCPSQEHCKKAIYSSLKNGGKIHLRKWETLKKKVANM